MASDRRLLVRIDVDAVRRNVSRADRQHVSREEIVQFLVAMGFRPLARGWAVAEADLAVLNPGEFTIVEELGDDAAAP